MQFLKIIGIASPLLLAGCLTSKDSNTNSSYVKSLGNQIQQLKLKQRQQEEMGRQTKQAPCQTNEGISHREKAVAAEPRQVKKTTENPLPAFKEEEARHKEKAAEDEAQQIKQAKENSLRTFKEEEAQRQKPTPQSPIATPSVTIPQPAEWQPLDGHIVRAGELVIELKRNKGGVNPSHDEMIAYLQSKMALTPSQAEKVLDELGL